MPKKLPSFSFVTFFTFFLYIFLLTLVKLDFEFTYRWPLFFLYLATLIILPIFFLAQKKATIKILFSQFKKYVKCVEGKKDVWVFILITLLAVITRFLFLKSQPFLTWGDELWDTGLDTLSLLSGETKNFYTLGFPDTYRMPSMGFIISFVSALFAPLFAHSSLMYRIPAAFFGTADILLMYLMCRRYINLQVAIFASLALISLPIHTYFSRTELVIISDAFVITSIISLLFLTHRRFIANINWFALVGLWLGCVATFHTSARIIALISLLITILIGTSHVFINKKLQSKFLFLGKYYLMIIICFFIGFGPKILFITPQTFIHGQSSVLFEGVNKSGPIQLRPSLLTHLKKNVVNIFTQRYPISFLGYINKPLTNLVEFHYTEEKPLLPPLLAILFLIGLVSLLSTKSQLTKWFGFFALLIPLTHSALTPELNWSYRMFVASSSLAVLIGMGMWQIISIIKNKPMIFILSSIFCIYLLSITLRFFVTEPHMANRPVEEYMTTHLSYFLQSHLNPKDTYQFCMRVAPKQLKFLNWVHAHNQYKYFAPNTSITVIADPQVPTNSLYLEKNCQPKQKYDQFVIECSQNLYSICPQPTTFRIQFEPDEINKDFIFYY